MPFNFSLHFCPKFSLAFGGALQNKIFYSMKKIEIGFTDKEITTWGGLILLRQMLELMHFGEVYAFICQAKVIGKTSERTIKQIAILKLNSNYIHYNTGIFFK